ncbi:hypothetical protein DUNSADRAFT_2463 [Dunaliella salina]|uniref:Uncharacterized protein n=1 Tax=Dunaliella salina TaxID=3046 RepID=A0ABQ7GVJ3_DUNSA|nr:hypothetical protein DUNSADRAFT_2463 [Dunaliella salina]|eukprot:KAF5838628.1 hypothetical protein DUNSADRAFT_2463 [Dunaliella salina]
MHHAYVLHIIAGMLSALSELRLCRNQLTSALPDASWGRGLQGLKILDLAENALEGGLPGSWGSMRQLLTLQLQGNQLSGLLPASWGSMVSLRLLNASHNSLQGPLPRSYGSMASLTLMALVNNRLHATIHENMGPAELCAADPWPTIVWKAPSLHPGPVAPALTLSKSKGMQGSVAMSPPNFRSAKLILSGMTQKENTETALERANGSLLVMIKPSIMGA